MLKWDIFAFSRLFGAALMLAPFIGLIRYGYVSFCELPSIDDWRYLQLIKQVLMDERSILSYLFTHHNGHLVVPARIAFLASYWVQGLDLTSVRWMSVIVVTMFLIMIVFCLHRDSRLFGDSRHTNRISILALAVPISLLLFAPIWFDLYGVASGIHVFVGVFSAASAILTMDYWLNERRSIWLVCSVILATIATISYGAGSAIWLIFAGLVAWSDHQVRTRIIVVTVWLGVFVIVFLAQYVVLPVETFRWQRLFELPLYFIVTIGSSVTAEVPIKSSFGVTLFVIIGFVILGFACIAAVIGIKSSKSVKYVALVFFGVINVAAVTIARNQFGLEGAASPRYALLVTPIIVGTIGVFVVTFCSAFSRYSYVAFVAAIAPLLLVSNILEQKIAVHRAYAFDRMRLALASGDLGDSNAIRQKFFVSGEYEALIPVMMEFLKERNLNLFRKP